LSKSGERQAHAFQIQFELPKMRLPPGVTSTGDLTAALKTSLCRFDYQRKSVSLLSFSMANNPLHYPWKGFLYLLTSPSLWGTVCCVIVIGLTIAVASIVLLLYFAFAPQAHAFGSSWWSYVLAVIAVLLESVAITAVCLRIAQSKCQKRIFVQTMQAQQCWRTGMMEPSILKDIHCCKFALLIKCITFPLQLIPIVGTIVFAWINAPWEAWEIMDLYFEAVGLETRDEQYTQVTNGARTYSSLYCGTSRYVHFGFTALLLESIPVFGPAVFSLSNACGAALWACDQERQGGLVVQGKDYEKM